MRWLALLAAVALLAGCGRGAAPAPETTPAPLVDDADFQLEPTEDQIQLNGGSAPIAVAMSSAGAADGGRNAAVWRSAQNFANRFNYTAQPYTAAEDTPEGLEAILREAAQSGALLVVAVGEEMAVPLHTVQQDYARVGFLLVDAEPHSADYSSYKAQANVCSLLFREEQAAYLAGYAAVTEGYTSLGFLGSSTMPQIVRYGTGLLQGAQDAAANQGIEVHLKTLYCGTDQASEDLTARMGGWYTDGTQVILAAGGTLVDSCIAATKMADCGRVIAVDWDRAGQDAAVLTSAVKGYNTAVQTLLYRYFAAGGRWEEDLAGQTTRFGILERGVGLPMADWRFDEFSLEQYTALYTALQAGQQSIETYSDPNTLPAASNVIVEPQNMH